MVGREHVDGRRIDADNRLAHLPGEPLHESVRQQHHVRLPAFPQGGHVDGEHVQPVVEIGAEPAGDDIHL